MRPARSKFQKLSLLSLYLGLLLLVLTGCFGRIEDRYDARRVNRKNLKLSETKPALLAFGALWCHPCLAEIEALNRAQGEFGGRIEILGLVVEGAAKGETVSEPMLAKFQSPEGVRPTYRLHLDSGWKIFSEVQPAAGRLLPTLVLLDGEGQIVRVIQRSLDYDSELAPELRNLVGEAPLPKPSPSPVPSPEPGEILKKSVTQWSALSGAEPQSDLYSKVQDGWRKGLLKFNFPDVEMPFEHGEITFVYSSGLPPAPIQCDWVAEETGCRLTVKYFSNGDFKGADGVCAP